mgnify:FL=1
MTVGILLAAGAGRRFGTGQARHKLRQPLAGYRRRGVVSVARATLDALAEGVPRVVVVTRPELVDLFFDAEATVIVNDRPDEGLSRSIALGIGATRDADGWLLLPADLPTVAPETVIQTRRALERDGGIVRPVCDGRPGHPVGFDASFGAALTTLVGDRGAQPLIVAHPGVLSTIETDDHGCIRDVDTPEDLAALRRSVG